MSSAEFTVLLHLLEGALKDNEAERCRLRELRLREDDEEDDEEDDDEDDDGDDDTAVPIDEPFERATRGRNVR
jgi:hypothetical protein